MLKTAILILFAAIVLVQTAAADEGLGIGVVTGTVVSDSREACGTDATGCASAHADAGCYFEGCRACAGVSTYHLGQDDRQGVAVGYC